MSVTVAGTGDYAGATLMAMILGTSTVADGANWDTATTLTALGTLDEYITTGPAYHRITISGVSATVSGTTTFLDFSTDPVFPTLPSGTVTPQHVLFYMELAAASANPDPSIVDRVPVALVDASFTPDGTDFTLVMPAGGLFFVETAPS